MYTQNFRLQVSDNGIDNWRDIDVVNNNILGVTDRNVTTFSARYVRLLVDTADYDGAARIYEFQLYKD